MCWVSRRAKCAREITWVAEQWAEKYDVPPQLATLTIRHHATDPSDLVLKVRDCWKAHLQGRSWQLYKKERGVELLAAEEITRGPNGWHPHMHVLLLAKKPQSSDLYLADSLWWSDRWRRIVERKLGREHVPSREHGTDLRPCKVTDYISKLGLELTDAAVVKSRSPLDLLREGELDLYLQVQKLRHRKRDITWSRGLRALRDSLPPPPKSVPLYEPAAYEWDRARQHGRLLDALEAAEADGPDAASKAMWQADKPPGLM